MKKNKKNPFVMKQQEIIELAKKSGTELKILSDELLENVIYPLDESISFLQSGLKINPFKKKSNFCSDITNKPLKNDLRKELDKQLKIYLQATRTYTEIMQISK